MAKLDELSETDLQTKKTQLGILRSGLGGAGTVAGWIYANKTGGGFWRYLGFGFLGGSIVGVITYLAVMPRVAKIEGALTKKKQKS